MPKPLSIAELRAGRALWVARRDFYMRRYKAFGRAEYLRAWRHAIDVAAAYNRMLVKALAAAPRQVSTALAKAVAEFEGGASSDGLFRPYRDEVGVWTQGYGHTENVHSGDAPWSRAKAETILRQDLDAKYTAPVLAASRRYGLTLNQKQLDALVSFVYNLGWGYLERGHDIGDAMAARDHGRVANAILLYDKAGGRALPGLTRRRRWERALYLGGGYATS